MSTDALEFAKMGLDEIKARLAQHGEKTVKETLMKFFNDQGLVFTNLDIGEVEKYVDAQVTPKVDPKKKI